MVPDVDLDVKDRESVMALFPNARVASQIAKSDLAAHNSGVYFQNIPLDPITGLAAFPYEIAEDLGYYKVDFLSNRVYDKITSMEHMDRLLAEPMDWKLFEDIEFVKQLWHFGGIVTGDLSMAEVVVAYKPQSIEDLACLIAIKLPAKKHLIGESWETIRESIWLPEPDAESKPFKVSHSFAYALVVVLDAKLKAL